MYWFPFVHWNAEHHLEFNSLSHTRIMGVLQRIALGYFFAALMIRFLSPIRVGQLSWYFLIIYWLILLLLVTGTIHTICSRMQGQDWIFGYWSNHMYHGEGVAFEPEGLLSTLPAIANVTFGYAAGRWVQQKGKTYEGMAKLLLAGALSVAVLCAGIGSFLSIKNYGPEVLF